MKKKAAKSTQRKRKRLCDPGNIVAIPLNENQYAFARILKGDAGDLQVYDCIGELTQGMELVQHAGTQFYGSCFMTPINKREWPVIGHFDFQTETEAWAPPKRIDDVITPTNFEITYRGKRRKATSEEVKGLEICQIWYPKSFIEEIKRRFGIT